MIPIIYGKDETEFVGNGLGRLHECLSCVVTEERNGVYTCDLEYPVSGNNYDLLQVGNIVAVTHDNAGDVQPFDIVSYEKPINGIVTFHCTHISYRQSYMAVVGSDINSLADAFTALSGASPRNPFSYWSNKTSTGSVGAFNGIPRSVRQILGGVQGSILDAYGGEYEWDKFNVRLWSARGEKRNFSVRYGVNMTDYKEDYDGEGAYSSCIPFWTNGTDTVVGNAVVGAGATLTGRGECVPLDLSSRWEEAPTQAQLETAAYNYMASNNTCLPGRTINVEFIRLQDTEEYADFTQLLDCRLCDTINVIFPDYSTDGDFKIVMVVWDVLRSRYVSMELGKLSVSLSEALGVNTSDSQSGGSSVPKSTTVPLMNGNASIGDETAYAAGDHVHPSDTSRVPTTRKVNSKALSSDITLDASDVGAVDLDDKYTRSSAGDLAWTNQTDGDAKVIAKSALAFWNGAYSGTSSNLKYSSNGEILGSGNVADWIIKQGVTSSWYYRKWHSGKIEAWRTQNMGSQTPTQWVTGWYYKDLDVTIASGIFSETPNNVLVTNKGSDYQFMVFTAVATSSTNIRVRVVKPNSGAATPNLSIYVSNMT